MTRIVTIHGRRLGLHLDARPVHERAKVFKAAPRLTFGDDIGIAEAAKLAIQDQKSLGACAGHATAEAIYLRELAQGVPVTAIPSRLWLYYLGRLADGTVDQDAGTSFASIFAKVAEMGFPPESLWPYSDQKTGDPDGDGVATDPFRVPPTDDVVRLAFDQCLPSDEPAALAWHAIDVSTDTYDAEAALAQDYPVMIGVPVDDAFCRGDFDPKVPLLPPTNPAGNHAMLAERRLVIAGQKVWKIRNSWGGSFGDNGYVYFSDAYMQVAQAWIAERVPVQGVTA